ncbi:MAG: hypothetical protein IKL25_10870 [Clostridia bacterium]|nr:hypothetical protein [Clostridia bacterium]
MRKILFALLMLICLLLPAAALADSFTFAEQGASCFIDGNKYTIITTDNVATRTAWLAEHNTTAEEVQADFAQRGVLLQAWGKSGDVMIEITAVQDLYGEQYYDVNQVSQEERKNYRLGHSSDKTGEWRALGYDYTSAEWGNYKFGGRFLKLEYSRTVDGRSYKGIARKTIRNGWHIHVDYQVYDRKPTKADTKALDAIITSWEFFEVTARPATSATKIIFTSTPPLETNTGKFTLEGSGSSGMKVLCVAMSMSTRQAYQFVAEIDSKGKFKLPVKLPREGFWMLTYTVYNGDIEVEEGAFDGGVTYDDQLLTIRFNTKLPETMTLTGSSLTISGTTMAKTKVQCIVDGRYNKAITTNNSGTFSFTFDTKEEGLYNITLVFEKKGYSARRFSCQAVRELTEEDRRDLIREEAVHPTYKNLKDKITGYQGRYMVYTLNIKDITQTATGYVTFAGMSKTKSGVYKEIVVVRTTGEPVWREGTAVRMYLKCIGLYEHTSAEGTTYYPYFDLQWVE